MTGKTYSNQDIALGGVLIQQMPLQAMLGDEKQFLIDNKPLMQALLTLAFTKVSELRDAMQDLSEFMVWSSVSMAEDPYADDDEIDAAELWVKVRFEGLTPYITLSLREITGIYANSRRVVDVWDKDEVDAGHYVDTDILMSTIPTESVFSGQWSLCDHLASIIRSYREALEATLQVTGYTRPTRDREDEDSFDYVVMTVEGAIRFYT